MGPATPNRHLDRLLSIGAGQFAARIQEAARA